MAEFEQILEDFLRTSDYQKQLSTVADTVADYGNQSSSTTATARETIVANNVDNNNSYDLLPEKIRQRVNELQKLNEQKKSTEFRFVEDFFYLIKKYEQIYEPLHEMRAEIVSGMYEPSDSDLPDDYYDNNNNVDSKPTLLVGIPYFWLKVLYASEDFSKRIVEEDVPILRHLEDIRVATEPSVRRFSIEFYFSPNEYFSNDVIQKDFYLQIDPRLTDLCRPVKVVSTDIDWNVDKCHFVERFVDQNTGEENYRYYDSFFNYFWSSTVDGLDDVDCLEYDWDVSRVLIQELVPNAVNYFASDLHIAADHCDKSNEDDEEEDVDEEDEAEEHDIYEDEEEGEEGEEEAVNYYDNQNNNQSNDYGYYDEEVSDQEVVDVEDDDNNEESKELDEYQGSEQLYSQNYY